MGMAASQARLLFITSRQNDVSAKMQRISNQNMILARDSEEVAEKYNKMLNNPTMTTQLKSGYDLNYNDMMGTAGAENGYTSANVVTDASGKVVLSSSLASTYGLPAKGASGAITSIYATAKDFVNKVAGPEVAAEVSSANGNNPIADTTSLTDDDKTKLKQFKSTYGEYPKTTKLTSIKDLMTSMGSISSADIKAAGGDEWLGNNIVKYGSSFEQIWQGCNNNTEIASDGDKKGVPGAQASRNVRAIGTVFMNKLLSSIGSTNTGSGIGAELKAYVDKMAQDAQNWNFGNNKRNFSGGENELGGIARCWETSTKGSAENDHMAVNLTRMLRKMTDMFMQALTGEKLVDFKGSNWQSSNGDMKTLTYNSKGFGEAGYKAKLKSLIGEAKFDAAVKYLNPSASKGESGEKGAATNKTKASYYTSIYEQLKKGWVTDDSVSNSNTLNEKLKNGTYKINNAPISESNMYETVADSDYKEKATAYYETEKGKINRKEKQLDTELTKLQTEYSSLTQDYNSVKSILDANIQRSFAYCQNG